MQNPIADMVVRIKNAQATQKSSVEMPSSKLKVAIAEVLKNEGYVASYETITAEDGLKALRIDLKYYNGRPVIEHMAQVSKPSLRLYRRAHELPKVKNGLGVSVVSTSKGVVTDKEARRLKLGGEVLCTLY